MSAKPGTAPFRRITETEPAPFHTVLTIHQDDLYPVCAFRDDDGNWLLTVEGPEDVIDEERGCLGSLYRMPTHWMEAPSL